MRQLFLGRLKSRMEEDYRFLGSEDIAFRELVAERSRNMTPESAREILMATGFYNANGQLIDAVR